MAASVHDEDGASPARLHAALLSWYDEAKRDLPWRDLDDPYATWVSEVMLQQTRVEAVVDHFLRWMARFPDVHALAAADEHDVLACWSGLGYYSRARNLQRGARHVVARHDGVVPSTLDALRAVPGIGPYTAGAIASIAHGVVTPAVDGNVLRVLARWTNEGADVRSGAAHRRMVDLAGTLVDPHRPGDWNQALMELGATVCTPRSPRCDGCPVAFTCEAHRLGVQADLPVRTPQRARPTEELHLGLALRHASGGRQVLLVPGPDRGLLAGLWRLPAVASASDAVATVEHVFTHRRWRMHVHAGTATADTAAEGRWVDLEGLAGWPVSTAMRKAIAAGLAARDEASDTAP